MEKKRSSFKGYITLPLLDLHQINVSGLYPDSSGILRNFINNVFCLLNKLDFTSRLVCLFQLCGVWPFNVVLVNCSVFYEKLINIFSYLSYSNARMCVLLFTRLSFTSC